MSATHYDTAHLLRELAEKLPQILPDKTLSGKVERLRQMADEELQKAQHDEWVKQKVADARADRRPPLTIAEAKQRLHSRLSSLERV